MRFVFRPELGAYRFAGELTCRRLEAGRYFHNRYQINLDT